MVPKTQTRSPIAEEEQPHSSAIDEVRLRTMRVAGKDLAARVGWLPGASTDTLSTRGRKAGAGFKAIFEGVDEAFAEAPTSEDLLWLWDNAQQLSSEMRSVTSDLGTVHPITPV